MKVKGKVKNTWCKIQVETAALYFLKLELRKDF